MAIDRKLREFETKHPFVIETGLERLYKFKKIDDAHPEYLSSLLIDLELYHALPESFNDPFECRPHWKWPGKAREVGAVRKDLVRIARRKGNSRGQAERFASYSMKNRTALARTIRESAVRNFRKLRICSFSASNTNILLWSHYADSHRGICVEFDVSKRPIGGSMKVHYQASYPEVEFPLPGNKRGFAPVLTKALEWGYEQEYRFILVPDAEDQHPNNGSSLFLSGDEIPNIYLGAEISDAHRALILSLISRSKFKPRVWQAKLSENSFSIVFEEI